MSQQESFWCCTPMHCAVDFQGLSSPFGTQSTMQPEESILLNDK